MYTSMQEAIKIRWKAIPENVPLMTEFVAQQGQAAGLDEQATYDIQVAMDEACSNIVQHAYAGMKPGDIEVSCQVEGRSFVIRIQDWGQSFEPGDIDDPDVNAPLEERSLGGLGLFLMRQFMDEVAFEFDPEAGNLLTMVKRLEGAA